MSISVLGPSCVPRSLATRPIAGGEAPGEDKRKETTGEETGGGNNAGRKWIRETGK